MTRQLQTSRRTLPERQALRQLYIDNAIAVAKLTGLTLRCRTATLGDLGPGEHQRCRGESPGGAGCLCECHDASAAAVVISRRDEATP